MINIENNMSNMKALFSFEQIGMERIFDTSIIFKQAKIINSFRLVQFVIK